jgi:pimeloyl-ACP methyl ester carboxylesterase
MNVVQRTAGAWVTLVAALVVVASPVVGQPASEASSTFVIVHGAWGGGWAWQKVDRMLRARGHEVYRPTLSGLGERVHLAGTAIGLDTHIDDVVNVLIYEDLRDVVLVGHSYGGMVITGVADRAPDRIRRMVYLDAFVPNDGESLMAITGNGGWLKQMTQGDFVVPAWVKPDQPLPHDVPHPLKTLNDPLILRNKSAKQIPTTYILTIDPGKTEDGFSAQAERAKKRGWTVLQMTADHNPHMSKPGELVPLLEGQR